MRREETSSDFATEYSKYYRLVNIEKRSIWSTSETQCHFHSPQELEMLKDVEQNAKLIDPNWKIETCYYFKPIKI